MMCSLAPALPTQTAAVLALALALSTSAPPVRAAPVTLERPIAAEVYVKPAPPAKAAKQLKGLLLRYDDAEFTLRVGKEEQTLGWADVTPASAVALRQKTINRNQAGDWLSLGELAWNLGAKDQAQQALRTAVRLDASLKADADRIAASTPAPPQRSAPAESVDAPAGDAPDVPPGAGSIVQPGPEKSGPPVKYIPATPEQAAAANQAARERVAEVSEALGVKFHEIETDHFLIFTDWDRREYDFLKKNLERAYTVVSRQFEMDAKDNIFVGKLPVYMFSRFDDFSKFGRQIDEFPVTNRVAGYYRGSSRGFGHLAMWKPNETLTGTNNIKDAERLWANVLVHEFTHAFLARYRSNVFIPRWLNEGCAEVIAQDVVPLGGRYEMARLMALQGADVSQLFRDEYMPSGEYYPVMHTMVELLVTTNKKNFLKFVDAIKDGEDPEAALRKYYNTDYAGFAREWREYAKRLSRN